MVVWGRLGYVSIHAPRVGCDHEIAPYFICNAVSIHAPRVGCDSAVASVT